MDILDQKASKDLLKAMEQEIAKANNELKCARTDIEKAQKRIGFLTVLVHKLIQRQGD